MYEFHKNSKGEVTEGYLGNPENFNGIVFLLKEPNNPSGTNEFWFKNMLESTNKYMNETKISKGVFTRFKNRFSEMMKSKDDKKELEDSIFCNIHPEYGESSETKAVDEAIKEGKAEEMLEFFSTLKDEITVFACREIYRHLLESKKIKVVMKQPGLKYKKGILGCFVCEINNTKFIVYEIYHPSRSGRIQV